MSKRLLIFILVIAISALSVGTGVVLAGDSDSTEQTMVVSEFEKQDKAAIVQLAKRLLAIDDEAALDAALSKLVADGRLTPEQSTRIKGAWEKKR